MDLEIADGAVGAGADDAAGGGELSLHGDAAAFGDDADFAADAAAAAAAAAAFLDRAPTPADDDATAAAIAAGLAAARSAPPPAGAGAVDPLGAFGAGGRRAWVARRRAAGYPRTPPRGVVEDVDPDTGALSWRLPVGGAAAAAAAGGGAAVDGGGVAQQWRLVSPEEAWQLFREQTSDFRGVDWNARDGYWRARIGFNNKNVNLGLFDDETAAARAYDAKAVELLGANGVSTFCV